MSRTDLDPTTFAKALRRMAGDGSVEWVCEPIQASVLLDMADMLDNNAKLHQQLADVTESMGRVEERCAKLRELCVKALEWLRWAGGITCPPEVPDEFADELRELGIEV